MMLVPGGPGSGKMTHCQQMTREKEGFVHISMEDILNTVIKETGRRISDSVFSVFFMI